MNEKNILKNISAFILNNDNFIITSHINSDGDSIGSELALAELLKICKKNYYIFNNDEYSQYLTFMPGINNIKTIPPDDLDSYNHLIVVDTNFSLRTGEKIFKTLSYIDKKNIAVIDHHPNNPENDISYIDTTASSTGELIFKLFEFMEIDIPSFAALNLYVAIITDTYTFRQANTTSYSLYAGSKLIDKLPLKADKIVQLLYESDNYSKLKLLGELINTVKFDSELKIITGFLTREMFERTGSDDEDTESLINYMRAVRGVDIAVVVRENNKGFINVNMRCKSDNVDLSKFAQKFGGGGHPRAAGFPVYEGNVKDIIQKVYNGLKEL